MWRIMLINMLRDLILGVIRALMDDDDNGNEMAKGKGKSNG